MLTSLEIRWFYQGKLPEAVKTWFETELPGEILGTPDEREDVYLYTKPVCDYLNIKLRQGRLEVKWRKAELGILRIGERSQGNPEKWVKWMCEDPSADSITPIAVLGKGPWLSVQKRRSQRFYQVTVNTSMTLVPITQVMPNSCAVEVTQLQVQGDDWWSLAFETFGEDTSLKEFQAIANQVFKAYSGSELQVQDSFAYPKWLSSVA
jgi:hypothetical protein